jgi:hypothetical protein
VIAMSDEEEIDEGRPSAIRLLTRNAPPILAVAIMLWIYATNSKPQAHTPPKPAALSATPTATPQEPISNTVVEAPATTPAVDTDRIAHLEALVQEQAKSLDALKAQVEELQEAENDATQSSQQLALFTALSLLKETIRSGEPFTAPLQHLYGLVPADAKNHDAIIAALNQLKPYAEKGVLTYEQLRTQFDTHLNKALAPEDDASSWAHRLQSLIRIRKVGEQQMGDDDEAILARAEAKLDRHDVSGAVKELETLSKPAATAMEAWMQGANAFVTSFSALDALQLAFVADPHA